MRDARVDVNQVAVVEALRKCGCRVEMLSRLGRGVPDLLVGTPRGQLILLEVKDGTKVASRRQLSGEQERWHAEWRRFPIFVVDTIDQALEAVGHDCVSFDVGVDGRRSCTACNRELPRS